MNVSLEPRWCVTKSWHDSPGTAAVYGPCDSRDDAETLRVALSEFEGDAYGYRLETTLFYEVTVP